MIPLTLNTHSTLAAIRFDRPSRVPQTLFVGRSATFACYAQRQSSQESNHSNRLEGSSQHAQEADADFDAEELLQPEEDWTVPGGYQDSLSKNTKLGRAVDDACSELSHLGELEKDSLMKANELLRKLGYKGSITSSQPPPGQQE